MCAFWSDGFSSQGGIVDLLSGLALGDNLFYISDTAAWASFVSSFENNNGDQRLTTQLHVMRTARCPTTEHLVPRNNGGVVVDYIVVIVWQSALVQGLSNARRFTPPTWQYSFMPLT